MWSSFSATSRDGERFERVEEPARIAVGIGHEAVDRCGVDGGHGLDGLRARHDLLEVVFAERLQHVDGCTREQSRIDFERRVLGGRADEGEEARLHVRQEGVLLALVEAVHLVHEDDGAPLLQPVARGGGTVDGFADVLHATQHRADAQELCVEGIGHEPRNGGLAGAWRPPEDAGMRLARLEGNAQRHARAEQVLLADHLAQRLGTQALGKG